MAHNNGKQTIPSIFRLDIAWNGVLGHVKKKKETRTRRVGIYGIYIRIYYTTTHVVLLHSYLRFYAALSKSFSWFPPHHSQHLYALLFKSAFLLKTRKRHVYVAIHTNVDKAAKKSRQNLEIVSEVKHNHLYLICWPTTFHNYNNLCGPIL